MTRNSLSRLLATAVAAAAVAGCSGDKGATGAQGPQGPAGPGGTGTTTSASSTAARLYAKITAVSIPNAATTGGAPTITYRLYSDAAMTTAVAACAGNAGGYAAFTPNFTVAKLVDDPANPGTKMWKSYINKLINTPPVAVATIEGSHDTVAGTLKDNGDGSCSYTYVADLSKPVAVSTNAAVTETYDPAADTRFGLQNNPTDPSTTKPAFDGFADFVPSTGALQTSDPRMLVADAACNACHNQIAHHGAKRLSVGYCVTCHNASTPDPDPTSQNSTSLNLGVMIHKIHQGSLLPSVTGKNLDGSTVVGLTPGKIIVNGTDYTAVTFPQDTGNCTVCHNVASGTGSDYWKMQPSIAFCGSCHDRTDFADATAPAGWTKHTGGAPIADGSCAICHAAGSNVADVTKLHALAAPTPANQKAAYKLLSVTNGAPGQLPVVTFSVTNPAANNANFDLAADPLWKAGSNSRLFLTFGWTTSTGDNWNNAGSGQVAGQPYNIAVVNSGVFNSTNVVKNGDGTYTATATTAIPANVTGSGVVLLEGHPGTTTGIRYPVTTPTFNFAITDSAPVARRQVVDVAKCDKCHGLLSLHGNNRTDNIDACVICHSTSGTDVQQRSGVSTLDGRDQQSIQLAVMVHAIHTGAVPTFTPGIVVYGFGKRPVDLRDVALPEGNSVGKCFICHTDANPIPSANIGLTEDVTVGNSNTTDQTQFIRVSKVAAVCSSCHSSSLALAHMSQNGASSIVPSPLTANSTVTTGTYVLGVPGAFPVGGSETCALCHGAGQIADTALFHGK
ncbi:MAG TPA: OmcA/MtrC family decaheme c-type cytochrome [Anaeromyxobacteraceae bacterium]|jgi:OmcA/MtrC family decaheme c-type cytochrome|nr:OmcA/MtrC family decaheme c-type cytochrome [Anaeromyxobacteraceae bacterium]